MRLFSRKNKVVDQKALTSVSDSSWARIFDWLPGKFQQHEALDRQDSVIAHPVMYACITRIASDLAKLPPTVEQMANGVWKPVPNHPAERLLKRPNWYQNHIEFKENWAHSKLIWGNTYGYKVRGPNGQVEQIIILDPPRVMPLVSESGEVFYRLSSDNLSRIYGDQITVPASEVIHDRMNALFHPLIGLSPLFAAEVSASQGLAIHRDSRSFFENGAKPSGILTAPGEISDSTAARLQSTFESYRGDKSGGTAVAGDGLTYQPFRMTSVDAQLIDQLGYTDEKICATYHVPKHMVGVGPMPTHDNIEALTQGYYSDCLQIHIEKMEALWAEHLNLEANQRIELDLERLFRTDMGRQIDYLTKATGSPVLAPNEARKKIKQPAQDGGDSIYLQQQNYSLAALAARDATNPLVASEPLVPDSEATGEELAGSMKMLAARFQQELSA